MISDQERAPAMMIDKLAVTVGALSGRDHLMGIAVCWVIVLVVALIAWAIRR